MLACLCAPIRIIEEHQIPFLNNMIRALRTWGNQSTPCDKIVVDYASADRFKPQLAAACRSVGARMLIVPDTVAVRWSRSRALNFGVRRTDADFFLHVDADCLLHPDYVQKHLVWQASLKQNNRKAVTFSIVKRLEVDHPTTYQEGVDTPGHVVQAGWSHCCLSVPWMNKVRGFHEGFSLWGREDDELLHRATFDGHELLHVENVMPIHLAHPKMREWGQGSVEASGIESAWQANQNIFSETVTTRRLVAPQDVWGKG